MLSSKWVSVEFILKFMFKVRKVNVDLCDIWINISETVHSVTNVTMEDISSHI